MKVAGIEITEEMKQEYYQDVRYMIVKSPLLDETWQEADKRNGRVQQELYIKGKEVKSKYQELVLETKKLGIN